MNACRILCVGSLLVLTALCGASDAFLHAQSATLAIGPLPRIIITTNTGEAGFSVKLSGAPLILKGFNYIRLRQGDHATFDAATKTTAAHYDSARAEAMLANLQSNGFNVVRVFICGRNSTNPGIAGNADETQGVYEPYMDNVLDFLRRAERHQVYVLPAFGDGELPLNRFYLSMLGKEHTGLNAIYFTREGIAAKARYVADFLAYIKKREPRLLTTLLGLECQNELSVNSNEWPFTIKDGSLSMPNGKSYDMADAAQRRALMNEGLAFYHEELSKTVKKADPDLLLAEGIFTMAAVGKSLESHLGIWPDSSNDRRFPPDLVALGRGPLDFLDIHFYRTSKSAVIAEGFRAHMRSSRLDAPEMTAIRQKKPIIMGEFGAFRFVETNYAAVVPNMVEIRNLALEAGFKGFLYWTYDCVEQKELYYATDGDGSLVRTLGRAQP